MTACLPKAILLDLDDTILAFSEGAAPCWRRICQRFAPQVEGLSPQALFAAIMESRNCFWSDPARHRSGRLEPDQARREIVAQALARLGIRTPGLADEIADSYTLEREQTIWPFAGAVEALRRLRDRGVRLALITSGNAQIQRRKIDRFGLAPLFDCILIEGELGIGKPDARVYLYALEQLHARPEETWMVGDDLLWDVQAPQRLGLSGIWLDFTSSGLPESSPVRPDRIIRSLAELVPVEGEATMNKRRIIVSSVLEDRPAEELWRHFADRAADPEVWHPWTSLSHYEEWKRHLERGVGAFWTAQGERLGLLAAWQDGEPRGVVRALQVPVFPWDRDDWGPDDVRGEIQDLLYQADDQEIAIELVRDSVALLKDKGLDQLGASAWRPAQCEVLRLLGFRPFRRSVLLAWRTGHRFQPRSDTDVRLHYTEPGEERLVQEVFSSTWGVPVTVIPRLDIQTPLVALLNDRPLGAVLLNHHSANLDLGVQVVLPYRRQRIGSALVAEALEFYHRKGVSSMYVVRNLPVSGLGEEDEIALRFYFSTGATLLREYTGFQLPPLP